MMASLDGTATPWWFAGYLYAIPPGQRHKLWNTGSEILRLLCCCAPAYEHGDTILTNL